MLSTELHFASESTLLQENGFAAERVPLSGSAGGSYLGDLTIPLQGVDRVAEVKVRAPPPRLVVGSVARRRAM
jgi:hypothetical protein